MISAKTGETGITAIDTVAVIRPWKNRGKCYKCGMQGHGEK
jgi:hypothetical protein